VSGERSREALATAVARALELYLARMSRTIARRWSDRTE
jgi:hypothetical protein